MTLTRILVFLVVVCIAIVSGCSHDTSSTSNGTASTPSVVDEVRAAGISDVSTMKYQDLWNWFDDHRDLAVKIRQQCEPHYKEGDPTNALPDVGNFWASKTSEQKICAAAFEPGAQFHQHSSHKTY